MKVYISGKITGLPIDYARSRFSQAESLLSGIGLTPVNPFNNGLEIDADWWEHMVRDIEMLSGCDAIFMLSGWDDSRGARIEYNIALETGISVLFENHFSMETMERVRKAIHEVTGLSFDEYTGKSRNRESFYARMLFAKLCYDSGMKIPAIADIVKRNRSTVHYYVEEKYDDDLRYNKDFRELVNKVEEKLSKK